MIVSNPYVGVLFVDDIQFLATIFQLRICIVSSFDIQIFWATLYKYKCIQFRIKIYIPIIVKIISIIVRFFIIIFFFLHCFSQDLSLIESKVLNQTLTKPMCNVIPQFTLSNYIIFPWIYNFQSLYTL